MMRKRKLIGLLFSLAVLYVVFSASSGGRATIANAGNTRAPGESQTCSNCHGGGNFGTVTPLIQVFRLGTANAVTAYLPGAVYDVSVTVQTTAGTPLGFGFQMTALTTPGNIALAGYSSLASNVKQKTITSSGRTYVEHNGVGSNNVFSMRWTAPAAGTGSITFYAAGNAVNRNNNDSGDKAGIANITLSEAQPLEVSVVVNNIVCNGMDDGSIDLLVTGGSSPYSYSWSDGPTSEDRSGLAAGTYSVTVTDYAGSTIDASFTITQPVALTVDSVVISNDFGSSTGAIDISVSGGVPPYSFNWSNGADTEDISQLPAGNYIVTIFDAAACLRSETFDVQAITSITDRSNIDLQIYPNPFSEKIQISFSSAVASPQVAVFNLDGKMIMKPELRLSQNIIELNLNDLPPAAYVLAIKTKEGDFLRKIVKVN